MQNKSLQSRAELLAELGNMADYLLERFDGRRGRGEMGHQRGEEEGREGEVRVGEGGRRERGEGREMDMVAEKAHAMKARISRCSEVCV